MKKNRNSRRTEGELSYEALEQRNLLASVEVSTSFAELSGFQNDVPVLTSEGQNDEVIHSTSSSFIENAPDTPTGFTATATGTNSIYVDWNNVSNAENYRLYRATSSSGPWNSSKQIYFGSSSFRNDSGSHLSADTTYYYRVKATNSSGDSPFSSVISARTFDDAPNTPTGFTATATGSDSIYVDSQVNRIARSVSKALFG